MTTDEYAARLGAPELESIRASVEEAKQLYGYDACVRIRMCPRLAAIFLVMYAPGKTSADTIKSLDGYPVAIDPDLTDDSLLWLLEVLPTRKRTPTGLS